MDPVSSRVAQKVLTSQKVARRFLAKGIPMGQTYQNPKIRLHRYRDHFRVQDLTFAGKRGKKVNDLYIGLNYSFEGDGKAQDAWLEDQGFQLLKRTRASNPYKEIKSYIEGLAKDIEGVDVKETTMRGVDVEPYGQVYEFKINLEDGKSHIEVKSSPNDFRVTYHGWINHPTNPQGAGHYQDTSYYPAKKKDAGAFYGWMDDNAGKAMKFKSMDDFRKIWNTLGVRYDSH